MTEDFAPELDKLPRRVSDIVRMWAEKSPDHLALVEASGSWTYGQLAPVLRETRDLLINWGVRPGDRVMLVCENCRAYVALLLATTAVGAWPVLVNARLSPDEVDQIRDHSGARRIFYTTGVSPHATKHAKRHGAAIGEIGSLGVIGLGALNETVEPEPVDAANSAHQVAALIYTSGTTGVPKGVMLTNRNLLFLASVSAKIRSLAPEDRMLGVLPMSHAVGLSVVLLGTLLSGATLYLLPRFDPVAALAAWEKESPTIILGVPAMFALLVEYAASKGLQSLRFPALRIISSSGAPLDASLKASVERLFGMPLHNGYGVTECSPTIAQARIDEPRKDTSVGRVLPGVEIKLVDAEQKTVPEGEVGELWVRGPNIMRGYYRAPQETAAAIDPQGWFNTRDLARLEDGNLFIVGRTKELIVHFGFNVYPVEVEAVLNSHPAVVRSAVVGRAVEGDEEVLAFVQLAPDSKITREELAEHAAKYLAPYKQPSQIFLVPSMPLTPTGKVMKDSLLKEKMPPSR